MHGSSSNFTVWTQTAPPTPASSTDPTGGAGAAGAGPGAGGAAPPVATAAAFLGGSGGTSGSGGSSSNTSGGAARKAPMKPICVGELIAHTDAVNTLLPLSPFALCAGGSDGLVSLWKVRLA